MNLLETLRKYPDTDKATTHSYDEVYEKLFESRREQVTSVLEIGVRYGGSLLAWRDYFPNSKVYGIDNGSQDGFWEPPDSRIKVSYGDSTKPETLTSVALDNGPFDIIIDDGCHNIEVQMATYAALRGFLNTNGIYIVEDVEDITFAQKFVDLFGGEIVDRREIKKRYDDILIVIDTAKANQSTPNRRQ